MKNVIEIKGITKKYKNFKLGEIQAEIPCGFATALIGANGAGKTTLIDILCGVTSKSGGEAVYFGDMSDIDNDKLRNRIGYCSSADFFPLDWTLKTIANSMELGFDNFDRKHFAELCKRFKLGDPTEKKQKKLVKLSDGNKMRTYLAAVLARDTELLVLDEPASSLDPLARDMLCDIFREYLNERDGERSVLFSTHNIADMEFATDYAIYMSNGKVIEQGFVEDLKQKYILVHGDAENGEKAKPFMLSFAGGHTSFEGIALAENCDMLREYDTVVETPTLQQLSVGILRKAEEDE
ncbi:MAG: ABC transporter ATP-binding protein [Ruminococcus sp.]|uniref:ATP-binding cassette domain-containing protein n=1 Tax=Ruminococcus sp. TaxID=41978 RepID=UPI001B010DA0|nr:ABC transporter ATP-binding protein [Ruminococcus sp.]MBO7474241.1 ABC transporter ATP-binding protein [Ruminococcus sp.]MBP5362238.1 ABC transporter ATP-binding protein [Ruminococcus sp.]